MKLICIILATLVTVAMTAHMNTPYPRYKRRGSVGHPNVMLPSRHHPPPPQFMKKLHLQQLLNSNNKRHHQHPTRPSRPIPVHMPQNHKIPIGIASKKTQQQQIQQMQQLQLQQLQQLQQSSNVKRPVVISPPVRAFWKNTQTNYVKPSKPVHQEIRFSQQSHLVLPEKAFLSSPSIGNTQEYDFHIQTNNIPTLVNPIKQVGEKGPIHTIPAPNLSPADRPADIHLNQHNLYQSNKQNINNDHKIQYQVSEPPEQIYNSNNNNNNRNNNQQFDKSQEQYQFVNVYPQINHQQQQAESYQVPIIQQQVVETRIQPQYVQALLQQANNQPQIYQLQAEASEKIGNQQLQQQQAVEMHSFNYEEQSAKSGLSQQELSSLVTAAYNLEPNGNNNNEGNVNSESVAHSQYVQNYFDTGINSRNGENLVEPDAKPGLDETVDNEKNSDVDDDNDEFYSTLPNKQAADSLAALQAAGKLNSNLNQLSNSNKPISIYVPDNNDGNSKIDNKNQQQQFNYQDDETKSDYEDYSQDDLVSPEDSERSAEDSSSFGHRLKPTRN